MKKVYGLLIGLVLSANLFALELSIGPKVDFGWCNGFGKYESSGYSINYETSSKFSTKIGGVVSLKLTDMFYLEPEVIFQFGNGYKQYYMDNWITYKFNTLNLPVLAKAKFNLGPGKISAVLGPSFDFIISKINIDGTKYTLDEADVNRFVLSLVVGAEYEFPLGPGTLAAGLRYTVNLTDLEKRSAVSLRIFSVMPSVAYMFKF